MGGITSGSASNSNTISGSSASGERQRQIGGASAYISHFWHTSCSSSTVNSRQRFDGGVHGFRMRTYQRADPTHTPLFNLYGFDTMLSIYNVSFIFKISTCYML